MILSLFTCVSANVQNKKIFTAEIKQMLYSPQSGIHKGDAVFLIESRYCIEF